jgi:hypothetical protein
MEVCEVTESLQIVLIDRFCKFSKIQNRELPYASVRLGKPVRRYQCFHRGIRDKSVRLQDESLQRAGKIAAVNRIGVVTI